MRIMTSSKDLQKYVLEQKVLGKRIGFVPTMGYLHEGHAGLMKAAKETTDLNIVSVFVNPTQFGPNEDFETYPRDFEHDRALAEAEGMDLLFFPSVEEIYSEEDMVQLHVTKRTDVLCGASRPGHFDGVVTVLTKLFSIVQPNVVYFGMKDAQQVAVVEGLIHTLHLPIEVKRVATVRETDGLARSSRNVRLKPSERSEAPVIHEILEWGKRLILENTFTPEEIEAKIKQAFVDRLELGKLDYVSLLTYPSLKKWNRLEGELILACAVFYQDARLIDNIIIQTNEVKAYV